MPTDTRTSELVLNVLSKQDYDNIPNPDPNQLYLVPEDEEHKPICYPTTCELVAPSTSKLKLTSSINDSGAIITQCGFVWSTTENTPTLSDNVIIVNPFSGIINSELQCSVVGNHYIRSFATNTNGTTYGDILVYEVGNLTLDALSDMWMLKPLPNNYTRLKSVYLDGSQIFNTGITYNSASATNMRIKCKFRIAKISVNYSNIYTAYSSENHYSWRLITNTVTSGSLLSYCSAKASSASYSIPSNNNKFSTNEILQTYNNTIFNGVSYTNTHTSGTAYSGEVKIGGISSSSGNLIGYIYYFYYDNTYGSQKLLIPCVSNVGRCGFYDVVNNINYVSTEGNDAINEEGEVKEEILLTGTTAHITESNQDYTYNGTTWVLQS